MGFLRRNADALPFLFPAVVLLFDILATVIVLSHEPGISAKEVLVYHVMLLPGSLFFSVTPAILFNLVVATGAGWIVSRRLRSR
jgi:hypothetical protein